MTINERFSNIQNATRALHPLTITLLNERKQNIFGTGPSAPPNDRNAQNKDDLENNNYKYKMRLMHYKKIINR